MRFKKGKRVIGLLMAMLMLVGMMPLEGFKPMTVRAAAQTYSFDASTLTAGSDKESIKGTIADDFVTLVGDVVKRTNSSGEVVTIELAKQGNGALKFTVTGAATFKIKVASTGTSNESHFELLDGNGTAVADVNGLTELSVVGSNSAAAKEFTYELSAGEYKFQANNWSYGEKDGKPQYRGGRVYTLSIEETADGTRADRKAWADIAAPSISAAKVSSEGNKIDVTYVMEIGYDGADSVTVSMKDASGKEIATQTGSESNGTVSFTPESGGTYTFSIIASRRDETDKAGKASVNCEFKLPLGKTSIGSVYSQGGGAIGIEWSEVKEAKGYVVEYSADGTTWQKTDAVTTTSTSVTGLTIGAEYTFRVVTQRDDDKTTSETVTGTATAEAQQKWSFSTYGGSNATAKKNSFKGGVNTGDLVITSTGGKVVSGASPDEIAFYYTQLDAKNDNFTLSGTIHVNSLKEDGGQVGFGIMAADTVGPSGTGKAFYNNTVATFAGKVEYNYDSETGAIGTSGGTKYTYKQGIGARTKLGVTNTEAAGDSSVVRPLATDANGKESGTYNIVVGTADASTTTLTEYNDLKFTLIKDNTGYRCIWVDADGIEHKETFYDLDNEYLTVLDPDHIYVGFFAARNAEITVSDVTLKTIAPKDDAPAEEMQYDLITPSASIRTTTTTGVADYTPEFVANADGVVTIKDPSDKVIVDSKAVKANEIVTVPTVTLKLGENKFAITFVPDENYQPSKYEKLSSYDVIESAHTVNYATYGKKGESIWVAPDAASTGLGSKNDPIDIYTAVKYVQPGQQIIIKEGTYALENPVKVARGVNGTESDMIYMFADPEAKTKPVFDFKKTSVGFVFGGDYWYVQGFDVTNTGNKLKAVQVSGNYNTLDKIDAYNNGDTGIQISRLDATDTEKSLWPSYNTILNCTSYNNADASYADADGFAAKITVGDGNKFIGCISHHNADDGWDLFAYPDTGSIGKVVVQDCVAYANGYLSDGTDAGNGNGFKLGGNSLSGYHELINSIAFENKAKGIDCNSCPDIQVKNCTTYNNGSYNIALYSGSAKNTDFSAAGVISFRAENGFGKEHMQVIDTDGSYVDTTGNKGIKMVGSQDEAKVITADSYYWQASDAAYGSLNNAGAAASEDWFESLDTSAEITRGTDGRIQMGSLFELTSTAPADSGARLNASDAGQASLVLSAYPSISGGKAGAVPIVLFIIIAVVAIAVAAGIVVFNKKKKTSK